MPLSRHVRLKEQITSNYSVGEIQCPNVSQVLTIRPNERMVCIFESTAEKLGSHINPWRKIVLLDIHVQKVHLRMMER